MFYPAQELNPIAFSISDYNLLSYATYKNPDSLILIKKKLKGNCTIVEFNGGKQFTKASPNVWIDKQWERTVKSLDELASIVGNVHES